MLIRNMLLLIAYYNHSYKVLLHFLLDMITDLNILFKKNIDIDIILTSLDKYLISDNDKDFKLSKNEKLIVLCGDNIPLKKINMI